MGSLGQYLKNARESRNIDIRDAAQQTRISINYLKALEEEDFSKLPGPVFVKGFLKNYARFLKLDEAETLTKFAEVNCAPAGAAAAEPVRAENGQEDVCPAPRQRKAPLEPFLWGGVICVVLLVVLFTSLSPKRRKNVATFPAAHVSLATSTVPAGDAPAKPEKLYLEIVAADDTWLLVRTDTSPEKKAVLKKGESLIWSADERFILSYGHIGDVKLLLNGEELTVQGARNTPVRDLAITRTGIVNQPVPVRQALPARSRPKRVVQAGQEPAAPGQAQPRPQPAEHKKTDTPPVSAPAVMNPSPVSGN